MDGDRVIVVRPQRLPGQRCEGHVEADPQDRRWTGASPESVARAMNADLGPKPDRAYRVLEGGAA